MTDTTADHTDSYPPTPEFATAANADASLYQRAATDRDAFWAEQAGRLHWDQPWTQVLDWRDAPVAKWF
ncbi:acetyl-coenzyme A synthetase N-terminal domain-containing protein, partial [Nocardia sp. NPDC051463]|uniref:acetyl-coenzyme A synthetase N-terminal domain-containing protein n=1 Tax=Nocardia sp. NPDC051463 TaxID=3154845 RepID=UPI00344B2F4A